MTTNTDKAREAFEDRKLPNLDLKKYESGQYYYDVTQMAFRDFLDGYQAATQANKEKLDYYEQRLEIDHVYVPIDGELVRKEVPADERMDQVDAVSARDATIELMELANEKHKEKLGEVLDVLEDVSYEITNNEIGKAIATLKSMMEGQMSDKLLYSKEDDLEEAYSRGYAQAIQDIKDKQLSDESISSAFRAFKSLNVSGYGIKRKIKAAIKATIDGATK